MPNTELYKPCSSLWQVRRPKLQLAGKSKQFHSLPRLLVYIHHIDTAVIIVNQKGWLGTQPLSNAVDKPTPEHSAEAAVTWLLRGFVELWNQTCNDRDGSAQDGSASYKANCFPPSHEKDFIMLHFITHWNLSSLKCHVQKRKKG